MMAETACFSDTCHYQVVSLRIHPIQTRTYLAPTEAEVSGLQTATALESSLGRYYYYEETLGIAKKAVDFGASRR